MNRKELRDELAFLLNFNEDQPDQDFTATRLNKALQYAYEDEVRQGKLEGQLRWFKANATLTWPASQVTLKLPSTLQRAGLIEFWDITEADPGVPFVIRENWQQGGDVHWLNFDTLQWGETGPDSEKTLRVDFMAYPEKLLNDSQSPLLVPVDYHMLIVWAAAVFLRDVADEAVPQRWAQKHRELQMDFWKFLSRGRPFSDVPVVVPTPDDGL
jgi:hypothetical protein